MVAVKNASHLSICKTHGIVLNSIFFFQQNPPDNGSLFTSEGLQPSINDLDNLFDDSSDETEGVISKKNRQLLGSKY